MNPSWPADLNLGPKARAAGAWAGGRAPAVPFGIYPTERPGEQRVLCGQGATRRARCGEREGERASLEALKIC